MAASLQYLGWVAWCRDGSGLNEAIDHYQKALTIYRQIGDRTGISFCYADLALAISELGNYELASQYGREALAMAKEMGDIHFIIHNLYTLGTTACGLDDLQTSRTYLTEALHLAWETRLLYLAMSILYFFAMLLVKESHGAVGVEPFDPQKKTKALELLAMVIGHPATWQPIKDRAARLQAELETELPPEVIAAARARGKSRQLEEVVVELLREAGIGLGRPDALTLDKKEQYS
ncbi:MAG: tetratricopeptide repeat protein [Chloroflexi bacterium]|nr:tetratricopeptide repeat protein [Chloroflexota bacterium]